MSGEETAPITPIPTDTVIDEKKAPVRAAPPIPSRPAPPPPAQSNHRLAPIPPSNSMSGPESSANRIIPSRTAPLIPNRPAPPPPGRKPSREGKLIY